MSSDNRVPAPLLPADSLDKAISRLFLGQPATDAAGGAVVPGELIVQFDPAGGLAGLANALAAIGGTIIRHIDAGIGGGPGAVLVSTGANWGLEAAAAALLRQTGIVTAEPNWVVTEALASNDPGFTGGNLWGMMGDESSPANAFGSQAAEIWARGSVGTTTTVVGVIDSGIDYRHADLYENVWLNQNEIPLSFRSSLIDTDSDGLISFRDLNAAQNGAFVSDKNANGRIDGGDLLADARWEDGRDGDGNGYVDDLVGWDFVNNDNDPYDDNQHGTHVAGTIGARGGNGTGVAGVNWNVQIVPLKFLDANGSGAISNAALALNYYTALAKANAGIEHFVATNNSWGGGGYSSALATAIGNTAKADQLFIAAAGNAASNNDSSARYPSNYSTTSSAGFEAVVAVASITSGGGLSSFSNYGASTVDLGAPGSSIYSTLPGDSYGTFSGTSMATPHVVGAIALMASFKPSLSAGQLRSALLGNTTATASLSGKVATGGRLDLDRVFDSFGPSDGTPPSLVSITLSRGALKAGDSQVLTLTFSEAVGGLGAGDIAYDTATGTLSAPVQAAAGDATRWIAVFTPFAGISDGANVLALAAGSYADLAGNPGPGAVSPNFTIDTAPPSPTQFALSNAALGPGQSATLSITFSEAVTGLALADFAYDPAVGTLSGLAQVGATNQWTATYTPLAAVSSASNRISLTAGSYLDLAGNGGAAAQTANFTVNTFNDTVAPAVVSIVLAPATVLAGSTSLVTFTFSEAVSNFSLADVSHDGATGSLANLVQDPANAAKWSAVFTPLSGITDAANAIAITAGSYTDLAGNPGAGGTSANFAIDTAPPAITGFQLSSAALGAGQTATVTITFSEAISDLALSDFAYNAAAGTLANLAQVGTTNQWTALYTPLAEVSVPANTISLASGSYRDLAGNPGAGGATQTFSVNTVTNTGPTAVIGTAASETLLGTAGNDMISGVPLSGTNLGRGTIDRLTGNGGADKFVLGDGRGLFYNDGNAFNAGTGDYGVVTDFANGDAVLLYSGMRYNLSSVSLSGVPGTGIYAVTGSGLFTRDELVGVLLNVAPGDLFQSSQVIGGTNYTVLS